MTPPTCPPLCIMRIKDVNILHGVFRKLSSLRSACINTSNLHVVGRFLPKGTVRLEMKGSHLLTPMLTESRVELLRPQKNV